MAEGTIKKLTDRGFGFIDTGGSKDLYFHSSSLQGVSFDDLKVGQKVSFTEGQGEKGPRAENVTLASLTVKGKLGDRKKVQRVLKVKSRKQITMKFVKSLWITTAVVFIGSLLFSIGNYHNGTSPVLDGVCLYCFNGCGLIPLPFAIAATIASLTVKGKLVDHKKVHRVLKVVLWGIVGLVIFILYSMASCHGFRE
jgi:CspA family cold shock protein